MKDQIGIITAKINITGDLPDRFQLFAAGWGKLVTGEDFLIDKDAFDLVNAQFLAAGVDMVWDYEHQTLSGKEAPAAGWITALEWDAETGIMAKVDWTDRAEKMLIAGEYRYHSPVFYVRKSDSRVMKIHSESLTNTPLTINIAPLVAKLLPGDAPNPNTNKQEDSKMLKKLIAKLKLADTATEDDVLAHIATLMEPPAPVIAKDLITALGLGDDADIAACVAKIGTLKTMDTAAGDLAGQVTELRTEIAEMKADKLIAKALANGQTSPEELDKWGRDLAKTAPEKFDAIVMHRAKGSVIPVKSLDGKRDESTPSGALDDTTLEIAKQFGNTEEDLKQYGGVGN